MGANCVSDRKPEVCCGDRTPRRSETVRSSERGAHHKLPFFRSRSHDYDGGDEDSGDLTCLNEFVIQNPRSCPSSNQPRLHLDKGLDALWESRSSWEGSVGPIVTRQSLSEVDAVGRCSDWFRASRRYRTKRGLEAVFSVEEPDGGVTVLGRGISGSVHLARHRSTGHHHAVKSFEKASLSGEGVEDLSREVHIYLALDHPYIARLDFVYEDADFVHLVMEVVEGGSLKDRLKLKEKFTEEVASVLLRQMFLAVAYLHFHSVVHCDLKLDNFMYDGKDEDSCIKLIDFGFAQHRRKEEEQQGGQRVPGTLQYLAPDALEYGHSDKSDVWALGVITHMLLTGGRLYFGKDEEEIHRKVREGDIKCSWKLTKLSGAAQHFVASLLTKDAASRPTAAQALQSPWFRAWHCAVQLAPPVIQRVLSFAHAPRFRRACFSVMARFATSKDTSEFRAQFDALDAEGSGLISLRWLLERFEAVDSRDATEEAETECHDDCVSYTEFLAACLSEVSTEGVKDDAWGAEFVCDSDRQRMEGESAQRDRLLRAVFEHFDVDQDGRICAADVREALNEGQRESEDLLHDASAHADGLSYRDFHTYLQ